MKSLPRIFNFSLKRATFLPGLQKFIVPQPAQPMTKNIHYLKLNDFIIRSNIGSIRWAPLPLYMANMLIFRVITY